MQNNINKNMLEIRSCLRSMRCQVCSVTKVFLCKHFHEGICLVIYIIFYDDDYYEGLKIIALNIYQSIGTLC